MSEVVIYTKTGCPYCAAAIDDLKRRKIEFSEVNITVNPALKEKLLELTGGEKIVPVIVENDRVKIGFGGG